MGRHPLLPEKINHRFEGKFSSWERAVSTMFWLTADSRRSLSLQQLFLHDHHPEPSP
jgi:hypothetical protein